MYHTILAVAFVVLTIQLNAQSSSIQLLDEEQNKPIIGATYTYASQSGISDGKGNITLTFIQGEVLTISHVSYGTVAYKASQVQELLASGSIKLKPIALSLLPVTIVSVHTSGSNTAKVNFNHQDHLSHDGASILRELPSIGTIQKAGNYGFDPVFRGFKYDQLNIVLNGAQGATAACPNRMDPPTSQMAPNMLERVEVLKGPYSLRYGAGLGATINFKSEALTFDRQSPYGRVSSSFESNGSVGRGEGLIGIAGSLVDVGIYGSYSEGNDYTAGNGETVQADFERGSVGTHLGFKVAPNQQLKISANYNMARDADFPALPMDLRTDDTWMINTYYQVDYEKGPITSWNTTLFGSFVDHKMDNQLKELNPRMLNASTNAQTYNYGGRTELNWNNKAGRAFSGADVRIEGAEGIRTREFLMGPMAGMTIEDNAWQDGRISKTGFFTEYHFLKTRYDVVVSGRVEINRASVGDPAQEFTGTNPETNSTQVNPGLSLGVSRSFFPNVKTSLWVGRVQRSGSLTERYINYFPVGNDPYEMLGNPLLDPEVNNQVDFSNEWTKEKFMLNVDVFAAYLQQYISSVIDTTLTPQIPSSPGVRKFVNIDQVVKTGFEFGVTHQLSDHLTQRLDVAYTYAQDLERDEPLPEIAPMDIRYLIRGRFLNGKLKPEILLRHVLEQGRVSAEFGETVTPSFTVLNAKVSYAISNRLNLLVDAENLLDATYYEHLARSVRGTNDPIFARAGQLMFHYSWIGWISRR